MSDENDHDASIPAFPQQACGGETVREGMTLRDYFAAKALTGLVNGEAAVVITRDAKKKGVEFGVLVAETAYLFADAMLAERTKRNARNKE